MADNRTEKCAHPSCVCVAANDSRFCSAFCEGSTDHPDIICNCGHGACAATETVATAGGNGEAVEVLIYEVVV
jgi:hypothetical protein